MDRMRCRGGATIEATPSLNGGIHLQPTQASAPPGLPPPSQGVPLSQGSGGMELDDFGPGYDGLVPEMPPGRADGVDDIAVVEERARRQPRADGVIA